jgi:hypothetical protein
MTWKEVAVTSSPAWYITKYRVSQKRINALNDYNSYLNNDGILFIA